MLAFGVCVSPKKSQESTPLFRPVPLSPAYVAVNGAPLFGTGWLRVGWGGEGVGGGGGEGGGGGGGGGGGAGRVASSETCKFQCISVFATIVLLQIFASEASLRVAFGNCGRLQCVLRVQRRKCWSGVLRRWKLRWKVSSKCFRVVDTATCSAERCDIFLFSEHDAHTFVLAMPTIKRCLGESLKRGSHTVAAGF